MARKKIHKDDAVQISFKLDPIARSEFFEICKQKNLSGSQLLRDSISIFTKKNKEITMHKDK